MNRVFQKYIFIALLFLIPTQFALHFWPPWSFVYGIRVDYLAPAIYLTDLLALTLVLLNLSTYKKYWKLLLIVVTFALINSLFSTLPIVSSLKWLKILELILFAIFVIEQKLLKTTDVYKTLFYSGLFFSLIGIAQFIIGGTTGLFYFLGERIFTVSTPGIALASLGGRDFLRSYSTFPHPNAFAGFLGIVIILSISYLRKIKYFILWLIVLSACFILTFSLSAFVGICSVGVLYMFSRNKNVAKVLPTVILCLVILASLILPIISKGALSFYPNLGQNISQRLDLSFISGKMIAERFWIGEGLNTFIVNIPKFKGIFSYAWLLQPVHNIFLLTVSETGIVGLLGFTYLLYKLLRQKNKMSKLISVVLFIVITGFADHYWLTLQQDLLLFSLLVGLSFKRDLV